MNIHIRILSSGDPAIIEDAFREQGIASRLMDRAEQEIAERSSSAGIGVGLFADYGQAQIMYVKRGYVPDGRGLHVGDRQLQYGDNITVDDDLVLYLTKELRNSSFSG